MKIFKKTLAVVSLMTMSFSALSADTLVKPNGCKGPTLCTSNPIIDGCGYQIEVGLLYEQMYYFNNQAALQYFRAVDPALLVVPPVVANICKVIPFNAGLTPGLRVGLGKYLKHDDWMIEADFEWMYSKASINKTAPVNTFYYPVHTDLITGNNRLIARFTTNYYLLDVCLSRGSYLSGKMSIKPFAGLKAAWFDQNTRSNLSLSTGAAGPTLPVEETVKSNFWGLGPMVGLNSNYHICAGWSIYNDTNLSVLFGNRDHTASIWETSFDGTILGSNTASYGAYGAVFSSTFRTCLGLQYDRDCYNDAVHAMLKIGYDGRYYTNQYPLVTRTSRIVRVGQYSGSWGMMGLILSLSLDF